MIADNLYLKIGLVLLGFGSISFFTGLFVLITRVLGGGINKIAKETQKIVQKGIAEEVAGLVGNASVLIESVKPVSSNRCWYRRFSGNYRRNDDGRFFIFVITVSIKKLGRIHENV